MAEAFSLPGRYSKEEGRGEERDRGKGGGKGRRERERGKGGEKGAEKGERMHINNSQRFTTVLDYHNGYVQALLDLFPNIGLEKERFSNPKSNPHLLLLFISCSATLLHPPFLHLYLFAQSPHIP